MGNHHCHNSTYTTTAPDGSTVVYTTAPGQCSGGFLSRRLDRKIAKRQAKAMRKPYKMGNLRKLERLQRMKQMIDGCNPSYQRPQNSVPQQTVLPPQQNQYNNQPLIQPANNTTNTLVTCPYCRGGVNSNLYQNHIAQCAQTIPQGIPVYPGTQQFPGNQPVYMGVPVNPQGMMATCKFCYMQLHPQALESHMSDCRYNPQLAKRS